MSGQLDIAKISWAEICKRYPDEWVLLTDIEEDHVRAIISAHVLDHDESMIDIMDRNEPLPGTTLIQTAGRPLWWLSRPRLMLEPDDRLHFAWAEASPERPLRKSLVRQSLSPLRWNGLIERVKHQLHQREPIVLALGALEQVDKLVRPCCRPDVALEPFRNHDPRLAAPPEAR